MPYRHPDWVKLQKEYSLEDRLYNQFYCEWILNHLRPDDNGTEKDHESARKYSRDRTKKLLNVVEEWQKDGAKLKTK